MKVPIILAFSLSVNFCFSQTNNKNNLINFANNNYKLQYPSSWNLDSSQKIGPDFFIFSPLEGSADVFSENINVIVQDLTGETIDLEKYKQITDQQVMELVIDGKIFESSITKRGNEKFFKITYSMTQNKFKLKITSICFIKNNKAYLATFSSEFDKYENYKKIGEQILNSFTVVK